MQTFYLYRRQSREIGYLLRLFFRWLTYHRLIAVTPSQLKKMPWEETRKICFDYTMKGLETISQLPRDSAGKPFRFLYTSGANSERDPSKKPWVLGDYSLMRVSLSSPFS
jgi:hypothetical protein